MAKKTKTDKPWIGWHFLPEDGKTRYSNQPVRVGGVLKITGKPVMCENGLHASARAIDALQYAPGPIACLVELSGERIDQSDKSCATQRKCLAKIDATKTLHLFACWCAKRALLAERKTGRDPDKRAAAWDAAWAAAWDAARAVAWGAAWDAAWAAAWDAARAAAWNAAWDAAWDAQNKQLEKMLRKAIQDTKGA